jgi:glucose/mannose transport system permease protein
VSAPKPAPRMADVSAPVSAPVAPPRTPEPAARAALRAQGRPISQQTTRVVMLLLLVGFALFYLMPVYVLLVTGLNSFVRAWQGDPSHNVIGLSDNFWNSVRLAIPATLLSSLLGSLNGYLLAKWKFRGSDALFPALLFGMFIPYQSVLVPLVQTLQQLSLFGTLPGLILVHVVYGIPITTLIFRNYYAGVPTELLEAAKIDGASLLSIYRYVLFPISIPGFVVALIWQFTSIWNEFFFAVTLTSNPAVRPITVALNNLAGSFIVEWNVQMAGALLAALPTLIVYIVLGRYFMRGLLAGSLKG